MVDAQNNHVWTADALIAPKATSTQNGGYRTATAISDVTLRDWWS